MAKQFIKDNVISLLTLMVLVVGLVTVAVNAGRYNGKAEQKVSHLESEYGKISSDLTVIKTAQTSIKTKQAFLEGVVSTQLDSIQKGMERQSTQLDAIDKRVDDLVRAD